MKLNCIECAFALCVKMEHNFRYYYCCFCVPPRHINQILEEWVCIPCIIKIMKERKILE